VGTGIRGLTRGLATLLRAQASEAEGMQGISHPTIYVGDIDMYTP